MGVHESGEMYLEAIHVLTKNNGHVRSVDVSEYLGYSKPSVSRAMGILRNGGYITVDKDGGIVLTDAGLEIAEKIYVKLYCEETTNPKILKLRNDIRFRVVKQQFV